MQFTRNVSITGHTFIITFYKVRLHQYHLINLVYEKHLRLYHRCRNQTPERGKCSTERGYSYAKVSALQLKDREVCIIPIVI
jgi:hypothetical protein